MQARKMQGDDAATNRGFWTRLTRFGGAPIALGVVAGLLICGLFFLSLNLFTQHSPDTRPVASAICSDLRSQKYDHLYTLLAPSLQAQGFSAQFIASQREADQLEGNVKACLARASNVSGENAAILFTLTRGRAQSSSAQVNLSVTNGSWLITDYTGDF